ncbi:MAG: hypothetical protein KGL39_00815 [Patescibacteria group bacterium]|nr:hypothetical protein [Patescibacteria group bacterium]
MFITEILDELNIPYKQPGEHHHVTTGWINIDCGTCSPQSGHFRLGINIAGGYCSCWVCGSKKLPQALAESAGLPLGKCIDSCKGLRLDTEINRDSIKPRGTLILPYGLGPLLPIHRKYLRSRGFDPTQLEKLWRIQGIGLAAKHAWRLFIPIIYQNETVSWTTRKATETGTSPRYITASPGEEAISAKELLLGEDYVHHAIAIVEGPADAWAGGPGTVATLGIAYTKAQVRRMTKYPKRTIVYDTEPLAQERAKQLCAELEAYPGTTQNVVLDAKDLGSASKKEIALFRRTCLD